MRRCPNAEAAKQKASRSLRGGSIAMYCYMLEPAPHSGAVLRVVVWEERGEDAFFGGDLVAVHVENESGEHGEGCDVREQGSPAKQEEQKSEVHGIAGVAV